MAGPGISRAHTFKKRSRPVEAVYIVLFTPGQPATTAWAFGGLAVGVEELAIWLDDASVGFLAVVVAAFVIEEVDSVEWEESASAKSVPEFAEDLHDHTLTLLYPDGMKPNGGYILTNLDSELLFFPIIAPTPPPIAPPIMRTPMNRISQKVVLRRPRILPSRFALFFAVSVSISGGLESSCL